MCLKRFPSNFTKQEKAEIHEIAKQALMWLNYRFTKWEQEIKYPFGPADIAQILITSLYVKNYYPSVFRELKRILEPLNRAIVNYLLVQAMQAVEMRLEDGSSAKFVWWGDYFQTAEVLESLALYYDDLKHSADREEKSFKIGLEKAIFDACMYIERTQQDGMWGTHVDTIRILYTYLRVSTLVPKLSCQPHLVFKALRWICDEKQCFADGSFLHTMFLTIFMAPTLIAVHDYWPLADKLIIQVYDDALWSSPVQGSIERIRCFQAETEVSTLKNALETLKERLSSMKKLLKTVALTLVMLGMVLYVGSLSKLLTFAISVKAEGLLAMLPIVVIYVAFLIAIWRR
jgi:hypothetical protein